MQKHMTEHVQQIEDSEEKTIPPVGFGDDDGVVALQGQDLAFTEDEERRCLRKIDLVLVPLLAFGIGVQYLDKTAIGTAATLTLITDLHLVGSDYSWSVSIYFFGLLLGTYPSNLMIQRYHTGRVVGVMYLLWGITMLCNAAVKDFAGLAALRFLLGLFESSAIPAFTAITARFYPQAEQPLRFALWALANSLFPIPFFLIYYGLGSLPSDPLPPWKYIFILLGGITVILATLLLIFLPDTPSTTWWLKARERAIVTQRVARSQIGIKNHHFKRYQMKEALLDYKVWTIALMFVCQQSAISLVSNFSGIITKGFGFTGLKSILLQIPGWGVAAITVSGTGYLVTRFKALQSCKCLFLTLYSVITITGATVIYALPNGPQGLRMTMLTLLQTNAYGSMLTMIGQNITGATKKQTATTVVLLIYCVVNIVVPQAFIASEAPRYQTGFILIIALQGVYIITSVSFWLSGRRENRRRDRKYGKNKPSSEQSQEEKELFMRAGLEDKTDKENTLLRYLF